MSNHGHGDQVEKRLDEEELLRAVGAGQVTENLLMTYRYIRTIPDKRKLVRAQAILLAAIEDPDFMQCPPATELIKDMLHLIANRLKELEADESQ